MDFAPAFDCISCDPRRLERNWRGYLRRWCFMLRHGRITVPGKGLDIENCYWCNSSYHRNTWTNKSKAIRQ